VITSHGNCNFYDDDDDDDDDTVGMIYAGNSDYTLRYSTIRSVDE